MAFPTTKQGMTLADFMALPETLEPTEFINNEVIMSPAPKYRHQKLVVDLIVMLRRFAPQGALCVSPCDVHIDGNVLQPDIFWVRPNNPSCVLGEDDYWHGGPDLVIEILSPATASRDRGEKFDIYELGGVREYWLIDPLERTIEVYALENGRLMRQGLYRTQRQFTSAALGGQVITVAEALP